MKSPLEEIPSVGRRIAAVMEAMGIHQISDLQGRDPEDLYRRECLMKGFQEDRCALYVWRAPNGSNPSSGPPPPFHAPAQSA